MTIIWISQDFEEPDNLSVAGIFNELNSLCGAKILFENWRRDFLKYVGDEMSHY